MSVANVRDVFFWCGVINYGLLLVWALIYVILPHEWIKQLVSRFYGIRSDRFDEMNYNGIVFYKILIIVFNIVPYIALRIVA